MRISNRMKQIAMLSLLLISAISIAGLAQDAVQDPNQPHTAWSQASTIFWFITNLVLILLLIFAIWAMYGKMRHGKHSNLGYHSLGALVLAMTLFALVLYVIPATQSAQVEATERAWDWQPDEEITDPGGSGLTGKPYRGYQVYLANGCVYCHTLYLRDQDIMTGWGEGARPDEVSQVGDYVHYPFTMLGTQRDGPDLTITGRKIPDMTYQIDHLVEPRRFRVDSIMPSFRYLSDQDLRDLAAFLVSLGNKPSDLRSGQVTQGQPTGELSELAQQGQELYRQKGCVGCHTISGESPVGPTWLGLYGSTREVTLPDNSTASVTADEAYLTTSILEPGAEVVVGYANIMPPTAASEEELAALIEYIKSLAEGD